jgi:hypothetical protein
MRPRQSDGQPEPTGEPQGNGGVLASDLESITCVWDAAPREGPWLEPSRFITTRRVRDESAGNRQLLARAIGGIRFKSPASPVGGWS